MAPYRKALPAYGCLWLRPLSSRVADAFPGFLSGFQCLEQPPANEVPHFAAVRQHESDCRLESWWKFDAECLTTPNNSVAILREPKPASLLVVAAFFLPLELHFSALDAF